VLTDEPVAHPLNAEEMLAKMPVDRDDEPLEEAVP
jgi:hypothetical protein